MQEHTVRPLSRRRLLLLAASTALVSKAAYAGATPPPVTWNGEALGGDVSLTLDGFTPETAQTLLARARQDLARLEAVFSLYDKHSALSQLNTVGILHNAPPELMEALRLCKALFEQTSGAFDPTVQAYWTGQHDVPIGFENISMNGKSIRIAPGGSVTLNGIAQGFITDRIADRFLTAGATHTLINLGEFRATGPKQSGAPWRVGLRDPAALWGVSETVILRKGALATSSSALPSARLSNHIYDPRTGQSPTHFKSVSVVAPTAAWADGLSTALFVMSLRAGFDLVSAQRDVAARFTLSDGQIVHTDAWTVLTS